jgi:hypothetical protein
MPASGSLGARYSVDGSLPTNGLKRARRSGEARALVSGGGPLSDLAVGATRVRRALHGYTSAKRLDLYLRVQALVLAACRRSFGGGGRLGDGLGKPAAIARAHGADGEHAG